jgi:hypothetical protein
MADRLPMALKTLNLSVPEYRGRRLIAIYGSWSISDPLVERLTGYGIYALRMGSDTMELANASALEST